MQDKCPHCRKAVKIDGYGEKQCPKCGRGVFITPDENDKGIMRVVVNLKVMGVPMQGDIFIDAAQIIDILSSKFSLENLSPLLGTLVQSLLSKK